MRSMAHLAVSGLAYAHPGGDLLFEAVSFRVPAGIHAALVGVNGVGKSTLLRIAAGELEALEGTVSAGGRVAYMPQDVGLGQGSVRELLLEAAPARVRDAGMRMLAAEAALATGDERAGVALGEAIGLWSDLGGYELEGQWDAACREIVGEGLAEVGDRPADTLSGESASASSSPRCSAVRQPSCSLTSPTTSSTSPPSASSRRRSAPRARPC